MKRDIFKTIEKNFGLWLLIMTLIGYLFPKSFLWGKDITAELLMFSFFLGCLRIDFEEVVHLKANYGKLFLFTFLNLVVFPVLLYMATPFLGIDTRTGMFLIMAASGGMLTPLFASFMGLNVLWAVAYVIISSSLVPFTLPLLVDLIFGIKMDVSGMEMILFLSRIVFPPAILAFLIRKYTSGFAKKLMRYSGTIGSINMALFIAIIVAGSHTFLQENLFKADTIPILLLMFLLFFIRYFLGAIMPSQNIKERWSNSLVFGFMNNGLIILFSTKYFPEHVMFVTLLSEIPWIFAQPIFLKVHQKFYKEKNMV